MITDTYLTLAVQSTVVLGSAALVTAALQKASAALRHAIWAGAFCLLLVLPWAPRLAWVSYTQAVEVPQGWAEAAGRMRVTVNGNDLTKGLTGATWNWALLAMWMHALGAVGILGRAAVATAMLRRRVEAQSLTVPMVMGLWRPRVYLPPAAESWTAERREAVEAHERQHVARLDLWWQLAGLLGTALYWPNPLVWWARMRMTEECEQACDDGVLAQGVAPSRYAEHLVEIARGLKGGSSGVGETAYLEGGLAMARPNTLDSRVRMVLDPFRSHDHLKRSTAALVALCGLGLLIPVTGYRVLAQEAVTGIRGVVKDASGAPVGGARVLVSDGTRFSEVMGNTRKEVVKTNAEGQFQFQGLPGGSWTVTITRDGYAKLEVSGLQVAEGRTTKFDPVLYDGKASVEPQSRWKNEAGAPPPPPPPPPPGSNVVGKLRVSGEAMREKLVTKVTPMYPPDCKAERVQGTVLIRARVGKHGSVELAEVINQLVDPRLVRAALDAVKQWRYETTLLNGNPVEVETEIEVNFTLLP